MIKTVTNTIFLDYDASVYECEPSDTLLSLKEQIEDDQAIETENQSLYYQGYWINEDNLLLGDLNENDFELILTLPTAAGPPNEFTNNALSDVWIVNGTKHKFKTHLVLKRKNIPIKLTSGTFGIVYHRHGLISGKRKYQVLRFVVTEYDQIQFQTIDGNIAVLLNGNPVEPTDATVYDENRSKTKMELAIQSSKILANVGKFLSGIGNIIFPGFTNINHN